MKLSWGLTLSTLCNAASAAREAHVYSYDANPRSAEQAPSSVTPETARLILAKRLGLSDFHSLDNPSEETIRNLNVYGGHQPKLFGGNQQPNLKQHKMVWVDDVDDFEALSLCFQGENWQRFTVSDPPSTFDNEHLVKDMALQASSLDDSHSKDAHYVYGDTFKPNKWLAITHAKFQDATSTSSDGCPLVHHTGLDSSITVVLMPLSSSKSKRRVQPYGTYSMPEMPRRQVAEAHISKEAPLSLASTKPAIPDDLEDFPVVAAAKGKSDNTTAPLGILKTCYEKQSLCVSATNGCTGHGECVKRNDGCWHCACKAETKVHDGKGMETSQKTIYWGGPACQKKDVSVPFWLLTGTGLLFAFLISSGIGLLYSMGSEELPSVIGAGVSGPSRK